MFVYWMVYILFLKWYNFYCRIYCVVYKLRFGSFFFKKKLVIDCCVLRLKYIFWINSIYDI